MRNVWNVMKTGRQNLEEMSLVMTMLEECMWMEPLIKGYWGTLLYNVLKKTTFTNMMTLWWPRSKKIVEWNISGENTNQKVMKKRQTQWNVFEQGSHVSNKFENLTHSRIIKKQYLAHSSLCWKIQNVNHVKMEEVTQGRNMNNCFKFKALLLR